MSFGCKFKPTWPVLFYETGIIHHWKKKKWVLFFVRQVWNVIHFKKLKKYLSFLSLNKRWSNYDPFKRKKAIFFDELIFKKLHGEKNSSKEIQIQLGWRKQSVIEAFRIFGYFNRRRLADENGIRTQKEGRVDPKHHFLR